MSARDPRERLTALFDDGSAELLFEPDGSGVLAARGEVSGAAAVAYCTDAAVQGGALGAAGCARIVDTIDLAVRERVPVLGLWHSGGARLAEGVAALHAVGSVFQAIIRASGRVPQISVVVGPAAGGAAYALSLTDVVVMSAAGRVFVSGPELTRSVTGQTVDLESLGGPETHGRRSGVVHITTPDDTSALAAARTAVDLLARPGGFDLSAVGAPDDLSTLLPPNAKHAYDVRPLVRRILDADIVLELHERWAPNLVTALGRLTGRTVGVLANNPAELDGALDAPSAEKAARFVRMCDAFGVPLVVLVDVPGYLPGVGQEWDGIVRRGGKLLHAFGAAVVPRVTLVTRKAYGGAYGAMNSRSLGATRVFAWPGSEVAVVDAPVAVDILHRRALAAATADDRAPLHARLVAEQERVAGGVGRALEIGAVDELLEPKMTRAALAEALASAPPGRGAHGNMPL